MKPKSPLNAILTPACLTLILLAGASLARAELNGINAHDALGRGILRGEPEAGLRDLCIQIDPTASRTENAHQTSFSLKVVKTLDELSDQITINGSAKGSFGGFGARAKSSFMKKVKWEANDLHVLVNVSRVSKKEILGMGQVLLNPHGTRLLGISPYQFAQTCGTSFLTTIDLGTEVYGMIDIRTRSYNEKQQLEASLSASFGSASASGDYKRVIEKLKQSYSLNVQFEHTGAQVETIPQTVDELLRISLGLESADDANAEPLSAEVRDYSTLANFVMNSNSQVDQDRVSQVRLAEQAMKETAELYAKVRYILAFPRDFRNADEAVLRNQIETLRKQTYTLERFIQSAANPLNEISFYSVSLIHTLELPEMKRIPSMRALRLDPITRESPVCGIEKYRSARNSSCGGFQPNLGTGESCGVVYRNSPSEDCGTGIPVVRKDPACGFLIKTKLDGKNHFPFKGGKKVDYVSNEPKTCHLDSFGTTYPSCRTKRNGLESVGTCRHPDFGFEFKECEHFSNGPARFKSCEVMNLDGEETAYPRF